MSDTALALITEAFDTLGVYAPGETIPAADAQGALTRLNRMLGGWKLQPLTSPTNVRETFTLTANKGGPDNPYTIGPGGDFDTTRPVSAAEITGWGLTLGGSSPEIEIPRAMLTDDAFQAIQVKGLGNPLFTDAYYNPTYSGDLGTIILWPVPNTAANGIVIYRNLPLAKFTSLQASLDLPDGADEAMVYNLAVRLAAPYGKPLSPDIVALAQSALATFKRANTRLTDLPVDPAFTHDRRGGYNILSGSGG